MSIEEKNEFENERTEVKAENKFTTFIKNNKATTILGIIFIIVVTWLSVKLQMNENTFKQEKIKIITAYESKIDSLKVDQIKFATEVFSWSVRSELLRKNTENLNQLLTIFVQQSGANVIHLVNPKDNKVQLSSDKKFEGTTVDASIYSNLTSTLIYREENTVKIICPVMGFNEKIGVLIVELKK